MRDAAVLQEGHSLPDPDVLWIRARIAARELEAGRALWLSAFRKTLFYGSLSAGGVWLALDSLRTAGIDVETELRVLPAAFGVVSLVAAILTAAIVHFAPALVKRIRDFKPF